MEELVNVRVKHARGKNVWKVECVRRGIKAEAYSKLNEKNRMEEYKNLFQTKYI